MTSSVGRGAHEVRLYTRTRMKEFDRCAQVTDMDASFAEDVVGAERVIEQIVAKWDGPSEAHQQFRRWARQLVEVVEGAPDVANLHLETELQRLHRALAGTLVDSGYVDEGLVSRRMFVVHLMFIRAGQ